MLTFYFLKRFFKNFILFFLVLVFLFSASDIFVRLPLINGMKSILVLFLLMLPMLAQFAVPIASCISIQFVLGNLHVEDEVVLLYFFSDARKALHRAVAIFSLVVTLIYIPIILYLAPASYKNGKQFIINLAKEYFSNLEENKFHKISPRVSFFFEKSNVDEARHKSFDKTILMFSEKDGDSYIINSDRCLVQENYLFLINGLMIGKEGGQACLLANFDKAKIDLNRFMGLDVHNDPLTKQFKFYTMDSLSKNIADDFAAKSEYHKRFAQIAWNSIFPFLALFFIMIFGQKKSNMLISIFSSGIFFLISYIMLNLVKIISKSEISLFFSLYIPIFLMFFSFMFLYSKKS